jgi:hypothetical protein
VNLIVQSLAEANDELRQGRPFFIDIVRDGIALYEAEGHPFTEPKPLAPDEARKQAQAYFDQWFPSAAAFSSMARHAQEECNPREAAIALHQAAERLYHCVLLVVTLYSPKSHKLNFLRSQAERLAPELIPVWPRETRSSNAASSC